MKAIHNNRVGGLGFGFIVNDMPKIHFESNSQHKPFTEDRSFIVNDMPKIHFESNSQLLKVEEHKKFVL